MCIRDRDTAWRMSYKAIDRANRFLAGLQNVDVSVLSVEKKTQFEAEARAIRAYNYLYLSKVFGPVPMLLTGETYTTSAGKARPENLEGTYQVVEEEMCIRDSLCPGCVVSGYIACPGHCLTLFLPIAG